MPTKQTQTLNVYGGFHSHVGTPLSLDGKNNGTPQSKMEDDCGNELYLPILAII